MAISLIASGGGASTNGGSVTLNFTALKNDVVFVMGGTKYRDGYTQAGTSSAGWNIGASASYGPSACILWKIMGDTPDTSIVCLGSGNSNDSSAYVYYVLRGVDLSNIFDESIRGVSAGTSTNPDNGPSYPNTVGSWIINFNASDVYDTTPGTVSGFSNTVSATQTDTFGFTSAACIFVATATEVASGKDPGSWSSWASGNWYGWCFSVRPAIASTEDEYGIKVSRTGFDVNTASDKQLAFSSQWPLLPIEAEGDITITPAPGGEYITQDIFTHNLGYAPVFVMDRVSGNPFFFPLWVWCDDKKIWFDGFLDEAIVLRWKIFRRPIETRYFGKNINIEDATKGADSDYGILVSLPGKSVHSTDKRDFGIRSDVRQLMVSKSDYMLDVSGTGVIRGVHNLGYKPMYLAYIGYYDYETGEYLPNTYRLASEADDMALKVTEVDIQMGIYGYQTPSMAYILFKDTLKSDG